MPNAIAGSWDILNSDQLFREFKASQTPNRPEKVAMLADWAAVQSAVERLRDDIQAGQARLSADKSAVAGARERVLRNTNALNRWRDDSAAGKQRLRTARHEIRSIAQTDLRQLISDYVNMQNDSTDSAALAADRVHVSVGISRLHDDVAEAVERLEMEKSSVRRALQCDRATIKSILKSDPDYSSAMEKLKADRTEIRTTILADRAILHEAISHLRRDEAAAGSPAQAAHRADENWETFCG